MKSLQCFQKKKKKIKEIMINEKADEVVEKHFKLLLTDS